MLSKKGWLNILLKKICKFSHHTSRITEWKTACLISMYYWVILWCDYAQKSERNLFCQNICILLYYPNRILFAKKDIFLTLIYHFTIVHYEKIIITKPHFYFDSLFKINIMHKSSLWSAYISFPGIGRLPMMATRTGHWPKYWTRV